jgi:Pput_2613-like deaminase
MTVLDSEGNPILTETLTSGGSGKPKLSFPEQGAVHTEGKGLAKVREMIQEGDNVGGVLFEGTKPPCNMCKGKMNKLHRETGVPTTYVDGEGNIWESTTGKRPLQKSQ